MRFRSTFQAALALGSALAVVGSATLGALHLFSPENAWIPRLENGYRHVMFGFLFLGLFSIAAALLSLLAPKSRPAPLPKIAPEPLEPSAPPTPALAGLYHEMRTYVDLEMWELALEKATLILKNHPGTREAELVDRNLNELRWKAEPKFLADGRPLTEDQEKDLREKGLAQMYQHVRTYMDLEMWELARQKAVAILKNFPDAPEALELAKVYDTLNRKASGNGHPPS